MDGKTHMEEIKQAELRLAQCKEKYEKAVKEEEKVQKSLGKARQNNASFTQINKVRERNQYSASFSFKYKLRLSEVNSLFFIPNILSPLTFTINL